MYNKIENRAVAYRRGPGTSGFKSGRPGGLNRL